MEFNINTNEDNVIIFVNNYLNNNKNKNIIILFDKFNSSKNCMNLITEIFCNKRMKGNNINFNNILFFLENVILIMKMIKCLLL